MIVVWLSSLLFLQLPVLLDQYICFGNSDDSRSSLPQWLCWLCNRPIAIEKMFFPFFFENLRIKRSSFRLLSVNVMKKVCFSFSNMADKILTTETNIL